MKIIKFIKSLFKSKTNKEIYTCYSPKEIEEIEKQRKETSIMRHFLPYSYKYKQ